MATANVAIELGLLAADVVPRVVEATVAVLDALLVAPAH